MYKYTFTTYTQHHLADRAVASLPPGVEWEIVNTRPLKCLAEAWNTAIRTHLVDGDYDHLIICNDDVTFEGDPVPQLISELKGRVLISTAKDVDHPEWSGPTDYGFFCFCVDRRLPDLIGYFDEGFVHAGFEDADMITRITLAGYEISISAPVHHIGSVTIKSNPRRWQKMFDQNFVRYCLKWGGVDGYERYMKPWNGMTEQEAVEDFLSGNEPEWMSDPYIGQ